MEFLNLTSSAGIAVVIVAIATTGSTTSSLCQWITIVTRSTSIRNRIKYHKIIGKIRISLKYAHNQLTGPYKHSPLTFVPSVTCSAYTLEVSIDLSATHCKTADRGR